MNVMSGLARSFREPATFLLGLMIFVPCLLVAAALNLIPLLGFILSIPFLGVTTGYCLRCALEDSVGAPGWHDFFGLWIKGLGAVLASGLWAFVLSLPLGLIVGTSLLAMGIAGLPVEQFLTAGGLENANPLFFLFIFVVAFVYVIVVLNVSLVAALAAGERGIEGGFDIGRIVKISVSGKWFWSYVVAGVISFGVLLLCMVVISLLVAFLAYVDVPKLLAFLPFLLTLPVLFVFAVTMYTLLGQGYRAAAVGVGKCVKFKEKFVSPKKAAKSKMR